MRRIAVVVAGLVVLGWWGSQSADVTESGREAVVPAGTPTVAVPTPLDEPGRRSTSDAAPEPRRRASTEMEHADRPRRQVRRQQRDTDRRTVPARTRTRGARSRVLDVVDGDTVEVTYRGAAVSVRVIGIDTPETVHPGEPVECGGPQASSTATRLLAGGRVRLVFDPSQGRTDSYGRTLAYLHVPGLGDFGRAMIRQGRAAEYTYDTAYARQARYLAAQRSAQAHDRGIWNRCGGVDTPLSQSAAQPAAEDRQRGGCDPGYDPCVPPYPPDLDCGDIDGPVRVTGEDPHGFDADGDGVGCDS